MFQIISGGRRLFYMVSKKLLYQRPTNQEVWNALTELKNLLWTLNIQHLINPKHAVGIVFSFSGVQIVLCFYSFWKTGEKNLYEIWLQTRDNLKVPLLPTSLGWGCVLQRRTVSLMSLELVIGMVWVNLNELEALAGNRLYRILLGTS